MMMIYKEGTQGQMNCLTVTDNDDGIESKGKMFISFIFYLHNPNRSSFDLNRPPQAFPTSKHNLASIKDAFRPLSHLSGDLSSDFLRTCCLCPCLASPVLSITITYPLDRPLGGVGWVLVSDQDSKPGCAVLTFSLRASPALTGTDRRTAPRQG